MPSSASGSAYQHTPTSPYFKLPNQGNNKPPPDQTPHHLFNSETENTAEHINPTKLSIGMFKQISHTTIKATLPIDLMLIQPQHTPNKTNLQLTPPHPKTPLYPIPTNTNDKQPLFHQIVHKFTTISSTDSHPVATEIQIT